MPRRYSEVGPRRAAELIVSECMRRGRSDGWSGSQEDFDIVEGLCNKFGVEYVDDFHGAWAPKKP